MGGRATGLPGLRKQTPAVILAGEGRGFDRGERGEMDMDVPHPRHVA